MAPPPQLAIFCFQEMQIYFIFLQTNLLSVVSRETAFDIVFCRKMILAVYHHGATFEGLADEFNDEHCKGFHFFWTWHNLWLLRLRPSGQPAHKDQPTKGGRRLFHFRFLGSKRAVREIICYFWTAQNFVMFSQDGDFKWSWTARKKMSSLPFWHICHSTGSLIDRPSSFWRKKWSTMQFLLATHPDPFSHWSFSLHHFIIIIITIIITKFFSILGLSSMLYGAPISVKWRAVVSGLPVTVEWSHAGIWTVFIAILMKLYFFSNVCAARYSGVKTYKHSATRVVSGCTQKPSPGHQVS